MAKKKFHGSRKRKESAAQEERDNDRKRREGPGEDESGRAQYFTAFPLAHARSRSFPLEGDSVPGLIPLSRSISLVHGVVSRLPVVLLLRLFDLALHLFPSGSAAWSRPAARRIEQITNPANEAEKKEVRKPEQRY